MAGPGFVEGQSSEAVPGRLIGGRYRLVEQLAGGGFGRVWKAVDESLHVDVAVKEVWLPPASSVAEHRERITRAVREARNAAKLRDHPHILPVHDVVTENDAPWLVMRLVDGRSLAQLLAAEGKLSAHRSAEVAIALLKALRAAHAAGVVHRDVKPANIMLTEGGEVLLTDFGISVHSADTALTATGAVIGSAEYIAPERLNGSDDHASSDLFSLGVTLYEAVEGVSPFKRSTPTATLAAVVLHEAPPPRRAGMLAPLITALLSKQPTSRPTAETALALLRDDPPAAVRRVSSPPSAATPPPAATRKATAGPQAKAAYPLAAPGSRKRAKVTIGGRGFGSRGLHVMVDSVEIGVLRGSGRATFSLNPGKHAIQVRAHRYRSNVPEKVELSPNSTSHFVIGQRYGQLVLKTTRSPAAGVGVLLGGLLFVALGIGSGSAIQLGDWNAADFGGGDSDTPLLPVLCLALLAALISGVLGLGLRVAASGLAALSRERLFQGKLSSAIATYCVPAVCGVALLASWLPRVF